MKRELCFFYLTLNYISFIYKGTVYYMYFLFYFCGYPDDDVQYVFSQRGNILSMDDCFKTNNKLAPRSSSHDKTVKQQ